MRLRAVMALLLLSGCSTYSLEELRRVEPKGTPFQKALAREYLQYSTQEERNYDWPDSWHFADKGLMAAYGNDVGPEDLATRDLAPDVLLVLVKARDDLLTVLRPSVVEAAPELAARAYIAFDCWVERAEDAWETRKIADCRESFYNALAELQRLAAPKMTAGGQGGPDTTSYLVFFDWNQAILNAGGQRIVEDVIDSLAGESGYEIVLYGHTDSTGLEKFNLLLSKKRAEAVEKALTMGGISQQHIKIFAFGESDPKVPTADGVDEPHNRRVEIFIQ